MSYQLAFYRDSARQRERASTMEAAGKRAKELIDELSTGVAHVTPLSAKQAAVAAIRGDDGEQPCPASRVWAVKQF